MDSSNLGPIFDIGFIALLVGITWLIGSSRERAHLKSIRGREKNYLPLTMVNNKRKIAQENGISDVVLVTGSCVIAPSYFMRVVGKFFAFFGGRVSTFENLLDRARREAILRLKEEAIKNNAKIIVNVRIETANLLQSHNNNGAISIEVFAYGTALK